jgi:hypothetical protein
MPQRLVFTCIVVCAARSAHGVSENHPTNHREPFRPAFVRAVTNTETMTTTTALKSDSVRRNLPGKNRLNWKIAPVLILFHVGAVAALFYFTWHALFVAIFLYG